MATWTVISPALGDTISDSLANIRGNFVVLAAAWDGDHQTLTGDGTSLYHKFVNLPDTAGDATVALGGVVYVKDFQTITSLGLKNELFYRHGTAITQVTGPFLHSPNGYTTLTSGLIMQWGSVSVASSQVVTFPVAFATLYNVQIQVIRLTTGVQSTIHSQTTSGFTIKINVGTSETFYWTAIGV